MMLLFRDKTISIPYFLNILEILWDIYEIKITARFLFIKLCGLE